MKTTIFLPSLAMFLFACNSDKGVTVFNQSPEATITSPSDGEEILEGNSITFVGQVSDANHTADKLMVTWKAGNHVLCESTPPETDGTTICEAVLTTDDTEISLSVQDPENALGEASITLVVRPSKAPVAEIITPESRGVYYSDQKITFEGLLSDEEDDAELLVAFWKSDLDGVLSNVSAIPDSSGSILGYGYLSEGEHAIELTVADSTGKTDRTSVIIDVGPPNSAPLCAILTPIDGSAGPQGETVSFTGTAHDVDVEADWLSVTWKSDKDGDIGTSTPTSDGNISFSFAGLSVNSHTITMKVSDEVGATCTKAMNYTVGTAPSIRINAPTAGDIFQAGTSITFSATVLDDQDQPNNVSLDWNLNGASVSTQSATSSGTATWSDSSLSYGSYTLVVTATDTDGLTDSDQVNFTVNGIPSQPNISITPNPAYTNNTLSVVIDSDSIDPEGSNINYSYEWLLGGSVQPAYTNSSLPASATSKGQQWMVRVTPNDGSTNGTAGTATISISNTNPTLSGMSITPTGTIDNDDILTCSAIATDPDEIPNITYAWHIGGNLLGSASTIDLSNSTAMPDDIITCTITATDSDGGIATDSVSKTLSNRPPTLSHTSITPNTGISTNSLLTCNTSISDDDGESLTANYTWSVGSNNNVGTGSTLQLSPSIGAPGDGIVCTVDVSDGYGGSAVDAATASISNTPPSISASITANGSTNTGILTCSAIASDVDDFPTSPSIHYEWFDASGSSLGSYNPLQLDSTMGVAGDDISCVATATDLSGDSTSDTATHTISNTAPEVDSISLSPSSIYANTSSVTCLASGSDSDGDTITTSFSWYVNGVLQSETTNTYTGPFIYNESITCRVIPNDGNTDGSSAESTTIVRNTTPVIDSITLTPSTVYTTSNITASPVIIDPDSFQVNNYYVGAEYEWFVNGTYVGGGIMSDTLSFDNFVKGDSVYAVLTPFDGVVYGTPVQSNTIVIANSEPVISNISLSPDPAIAGSDDLSCMVSAYDNDFDPIVYTYVWSDSNGIQQTTTEVSNASDIYLTAGLSEDTWTCEVTPYDGTDYGASDTASTTVEAGSFSCGETFIDARDNQVYDTVQIGSVCWMRENLNVGTFLNSSSTQDPTGPLTKWCYDDLESNCDIWGGQYTYLNAVRNNADQVTQGICPTGWRIPTEAEWNSLHSLQGSAMFIVSETTASLLFSGRRTNQWLYGTLCTTSVYVQVHHWYSDTGGGGFAWAYNNCPSPNNYLTSPGQLEQGRAIRCVEM